MKLDFWAGGFAFEDDPADLKERAAFCAFCQLVLEMSTGKRHFQLGRTRWERNQSTLSLANYDTFPVMSIFRSKGELNGRL